MDKFKICDILKIELINHLKILTEWLLAVSNISTMAKKINEKRSHGQYKLYILFLRVLIFNSNQ